MFRFLPCRERFYICGPSDPDHTSDIAMNPLLPSMSNGGHVDQSISVRVWPAELLRNIHSSVSPQLKGPSSASFPTSSANFATPHNSDPDVLGRFCKRFSANSEASPPTRVYSCKAVSSSVVEYDTRKHVTDEKATRIAAAAEAVTKARAAFAAAKDAVLLSRRAAAARSQRLISGGLGSFPTIDDLLRLDAARAEALQDGGLVLEGNSAVESERDAASRAEDANHGTGGADTLVKPRVYYGGEDDAEGQWRQDPQVAEANDRSTHSNANSAAVQPAEGLGNDDVTAAPLVPFGGLESTLVKGQIIARSKRRTERALRRERASAKADTIASLPTIATIGKPKRITKKEAAAELVSRVHVSSQIGKAKLLTAAEEVELSKKIQDLLMLERHRESLAEQLGRDPTRPEFAKSLNLTAPMLEKRLRTGKESKERMILSNMRLVYSIAKKYSGRGVALDDLVTDGCRGLIRGTEKFDHTKGFKFSTYAHWWIRQAVSRTITDQSRTIRLPVHIFEVLSRIHKAKTMLTEEHGREPTAAEVAELVGISPQKLRAVLRNSRVPLSMEKPIGKDGDETLGEMVADTESEVHMKEDSRKMLKADLENVLHTLNPRERDVMRLRYGMEDGRARTLEEVGNLFKVTRERIRQIETKALRKLRQPSRSGILLEYVEGGMQEGLAVN